MIHITLIGGVKVMSSITRLNDVIYTVKMEKVQACRWYIHHKLKCVFDPEIQPRHGHVILKSALSTDVL